MEPDQRPITPTRLLPDSYTRIWGLDLARDRKTAIVLNLVSLPLFVVAGWVFFHAASVVRPDITNSDFIRRLSFRPLVLYVDFLAVVVFTTLVHELIHGLFFWVFTRTKPVIGIKLLFAYAGAPDWYIPRNRYSVIGFAPLVLITVVGFLAIPFMPLMTAQLVLFAIVMNAAGAIGDIYVCGKVLTLPPDILVRDTGYVFDVFGRTESPNSTVP